MANILAYPSISEEVLEQESSPSIWTNLTNAYAADSTYADCAASTQLNSAVFSGYGFSLPANVLITGIKLETSIFGTSGTSTGQDNSIRLMSGGLPKGDDLANAAEYTLLTTTNRIYGGSSNLWNATWTKSEVESSTFGVSLQYFCSTSATLSLDYARLTVYYVDPLDLIFSSASMMMNF